MQIIQDTTEFQIRQKTAVAIGKFDGIHRGHEKLLSCILEQKKKGMAAVVFTFFPSRSTVIRSPICAYSSRRWEI